MIRCVCSLVFVLGLTGLALAGDKNKPNTLTEKEIADGWLLLFDGETTFGWEVDGEAEVKDGILRVGGLKDTTLKFRTPFAFFHFAFQANVIKTGDDSTRPEIQFQKGDKIEAKVDLSSPPLPGGIKVAWGEFQATIEKKTGQELPVFYASGSWRFEPNSKGVFSDKKGIGFGSAQDTPIKNFKTSDIQIRIPKGYQVFFKDIKLQPLATQPLFNGKDLTGWKVLPGNKSVYSVTKEGYLNVKDGKGDIQTTDTFKDFVLQLECISNGDNLNSGIFFRGLLGEYQQGYEAQIHNGFKPDMPKVYKVDKYDPKTHEKTGTVDMTSTAVDFGTGAIYRRLPARKAVAKDREWFAMTVVAHGNHFATWVNGIQVVDWADNRPPDKNGRNGFCANPGVISIQGHDPTTDLSFRNLRIAEYP